MEFCDVIMSFASPYTQFPPGKYRHIIAIDTSEMYTQMKHGVRPMCSFLLLMAAAATLTFLVMFHQSGPFRLKCEFWSVEIGPKPVFNKTLLKHAATDLADPGLEREIAKLLKGYIGHRDLGVRAFWFNLKRSLLPRFLTHLGEWARKRRSALSGLMSGLPDEFKFLTTGGELGPGRRLFESCAVVGNSGILLQRNYGEVIDGHEAVIRLNNAATKSFETHVGSKTNVSFVNSNVLHVCSVRRNFRCNPYGPGVATVTYICQPRHFFDYMVCAPSMGGRLAVTDPRFDVLCGRIVKYYSLRRFIEKTGKGVEEWGPAHGGAEFHYSSGMQAVMLAAGLCRRVGIFGFGKSVGARHHYHTRQKAELALHDYEAEYEFYRDLVERPWAVPFVEGEFEFPTVAVYE